MVDILHFDVTIDVEHINNDRNDELRCKAGNMLRELRQWSIDAIDYEVHAH
jgi:hypothetical protein